VLVCTPGGPTAAMLALKKKDGSVVWKTPMASAHRAGYASAVAARAGKAKLYVQFMAAHLVGVDAKTGKLLWKYRKNVGGVSANAPIVHDGHVFATASGNTGAGGDALLKLVEKAGEVTVQQVYLKTGLKAFHGGAVKVGDHVYGTGGSGLVCLDFKTGDVKWRHRSIGPGSLLVAGGRIYLRNARGDVALVQATPEGYREKGRLAQPKRSKYPTFAHPVVAGGRLYLRDEGMMFCYDVREKGE
jgi:outer membrane protein assembly factor BamB